MNRQQIGAALLSLLVVTSVLAGVAGMAAADVDDEVDTSHDAYQGGYIWYGTETLDNYDRGALDDPTVNLQIHDDQGDVVDLNGTVNASQDEPVGVNYSKIEADRYSTFPRVSGESDEDDDGIDDETWTNHANWTTTSDASSSITLSDDSTVGAVPAVQFDTTVVAGEEAAGVFDREVSITEDVSKRVAFVGINIADLTGDAHVRFQDADGDYYYANASTEATANDKAIIANSTDNGLLFQTRLDSLPVADNGSGSADSTVDSIKSVRVVGVGGNTDVTVWALDVGSKSIVDLGERYRDTDGDGDEETETFQRIDGTNASGVEKLTGLSSMGTWADNAVLHDLEVYDVRYPAHLSGLEASAELENASGHAAYESMLNLSIRTESPSYIDVAHSTGELRADKAVVGERYLVAEYATGVGNKDLGNVSESSFTERTSYFEANANETGDAVTLASGVSGGTTVEYHFKYLVTADEGTGLMSTGGGAVVGPMDDSGGGGILGNIWAWALGIFGTIATVLGLNKLSSG